MRFLFLVALSAWGSESDEPLDSDDCPPGTYEDCYIHG